MKHFKLGQLVKDNEIYKEYFPSTKGKVIGISPIIVQYWDCKIRYTQLEADKYLSIA